MTITKKFKFLESAIANANVIWWSMDLEGNYTSSRGLGLKSLGLADSEAVGKNHFDLYKDESISTANVRRALKGESFSAESELNNHIFQTYYEPIYNDQNKIEGITGFSIDITERVQALRKSKQNEIELARERDHLREMFDNTPNFIAILEGPDFNFVRVNQRYSQLVAHRKIIGKPILEALPELKGQGFEEILKKVYSTGESFVGEETPIQLQVKENGPVEERFLDFMYQRILYPDGTPRGVFAHGVDVTEKVMTRRKIEQSEKLFRTFADSMPHMAFVADKTGAITFFNKKWYEFIGNMEGTEGWGYKDRPIHHPDDLQRTLDRWTHSVKTGEPYEIEYRLKGVAGVYRWHAGRANPVRDQNGEIYCWVGTNTDIHDEKMLIEQLAESELKFRTIADAMPQMVWSTLPDGFHDYYNDRWYEFTGVPYGSTDGEGWNEMFHPEDQLRAKESWEHCLRTGDPYMIEYRLRRFDGIYRWTLGRALPVRNIHGEIIRWMGTCTDIHDIKENEEKLFQTQIELKKSLTARDEFLSIASHELKTPLTSLKLQTQSMKRNFEKGRMGAFSPEKVSELISNNEKQISRLVRLVDDMLDLTRIESGKLSFEYESEDFSAITAEVASRLREQIEYAGCTLSIDLVSECMVQADRSRLEQVVTNLLTNAMKYGTGKPVEVTLKKNDGFAILIVRDHGQGISKENHDKVFNKFERLVDASSVSGLGLGLYITKEIVDAHHGKIWVESELGEGSTFYVKLQLEKK